jgi:hyperosmotically inducible periplasmic protein
MLSKNLQEGTMLQRLAVLLCGAALTVACGQTDAGITTAVKSKLAADSTVKAYEINVDTRNHVVTLSGEVQSSAAKDQALRLARETDGVRDVVDRLQVGETAATSGVGIDYDKPNLNTDVDDKAKAKGKEAGHKAAEAADKAGGVVTDAALTSAVKAKFLADSKVSGMKIDVDTNNGVVTLTGNVASKAEEEQAVKLASGTEGVRHVVNKLHVK